MIRAITLSRLTARLVAIVSFTALIYDPSPALAVPILGSTLAKYAVLGASDVTCVPTCTIGGNVGSFPTAPTALGTSFSFPSFGFFQPLATATEDLAQTQLTAAIGAVNAFTLTDTIVSGDLDAYQTLQGGSIAPGTYDVTAIGSLVGTLILDGGGSSTAVWAFRFASSLVTGTSSNVTVTDVGDGSGVGLYWVTGTAATINGPTFAGNVMAGTSITSDGSLVMSCGRLLADTGNVTMNADTISIGCAGFETSGGFDQGNPNTGAPGGGNGTVPQPSAFLLLGSGLAGLFVFRKFFAAGLTG